DFTNKNLILPNKSLIYLSSDGFADQNDSERKSFGLNNFKNLLFSVKDLSLEDQHAQILFALKAHQKDEPQRDDISVMGLSI
ncbi:MAG: serine/threonine protein kinase, partial [Bacteroidetes bacterium]